ncbi:MAG: TonB-dependent receptor [Bacteroidetes bacterium]|nr:TonB-dependent receptor [Bacteroidota bacterium]
MQITKTALFLLITGIGLNGFSQTKHTISGTIRDKSSGEVLIGATALLLEKPTIAGTSNSYGFFSLTAPDAEYSLVFSFAGYQPDTIKINLNRDIEQLVKLAPQSTTLQQVIVSAQKRNLNVTGALMGVQKLTMQEINNVPVLFGEKDILKTLQLLPGIKSAGDGNSGFFVRGGAADQNLMLLDEAVVYNPSHLLGFFSTFNSDAIKDVTVYKGGMPAEYGGRLSSVVDIKMNDGNNQHFAGSGGIGLISSRLNLEGPIVKDQGSFTVSARRTYADLFLKLSKDSSVNKNSLYFYDLNLKANYKLGKKDRVYLSGYFGRDVLSFANTFGIKWGNSTATARWNHVFNSKLFSNTSFIYSNYNYVINISANNNNINIVSQIRDYSLKEDLQYYINPANVVKFGVDLIHHTFSPGVINASQTSSYNSLNLPKKYDLESAAYISHEWSPSERFHLVYGLRLSVFSVFGPGNFYTYDSNGNTLDTATYGSGKVVKNYINPEPRFSASWMIDDNSSFKFSYTRNVQNLHLLSNSTAGNPTDLWAPSSNNIKPEIADQEAIGYFRNFANNKYEFSSELYYKSMQNQIDYKNGAQLVANVNVESQLLYGKGRAYGWEVFFKKKEGKLTGWVGYTLSRTEIKIDGINNGSWYPAKQDITHDVSIVGIFKASKKWTLSATWVYNTGAAVTFPNGKYDVNGQTVFYYTQRNGYRMPAYHRLDLGATLIAKQTKKWESSWTFSVYNAYNHANAYAIIFQNDPNNPSQTQAVQYSLFKIVPSITYNFKF